MKSSSYLTARKWFILDKSMLAATHGQTDRFLLLQNSSSWGQEKEQISQNHRIVRLRVSVPFWHSIYHKSTEKSISSKCAKTNQLKNISSRWLKDWSWIKYTNIPITTNGGRSDLLKFTCRFKLKEGASTQLTNQNSFGKLDSWFEKRRQLSKDAAMLGNFRTD